MKNVLDLVAAAIVMLAGGQPPLCSPPCDRVEGTGRRCEKTLAQRS